MLGRSCSSLDFSLLEGNEIAHLLAKYTRSLSDFIVWLENPPSCLILKFFNESFFSLKKKKKSNMQMTCDSGN